MSHLISPLFTASGKLDFGFIVRLNIKEFFCREAKSRRDDDGGGESGRHMKEYYCFFCILMTAPERRQRRQRREAEEAEVNWFKEAEPSVCLSNRKKRKEGWRDWRKERMALFSLHQ